MDALRPSAVLLLSCALLAGASYVRRLDVFSAGPLAESAAPSLLSCAAWCNRTSGCVGFTFTDGGQCQLFDGILRSGADTSSAVPLTYSLVKVEPCPSGWLRFRDSCYTRQNPDVKQIWDEYRVACQGLAKNADLAVPDDDPEVIWMAHHPSRPSVHEYVGLKINAGAVVNMDGTSYSVQLDLYSMTDPGCVNLRSSRKLVKPFNSFTCDTTRDGFVCESPSICSPCPYGWLTLDDYCYHYVSTAMAWQAADDHCAGLQPGARLSPVISMEIYTVLYHSLSLPSYIWVGLTDVEVDGTWKAVDGTESSFTWLPNEPNGGTGENCLEFNANGANDLTCTLSKPFVCRVRKDFCLE